MTTTAPAPAGEPSVSTTALTGRSLVVLASVLVIVALGFGLALGQQLQSDAAPAGPTGVTGPSGSNGTTTTTSTTLPSGDTVSLENGVAIVTIPPGWKNTGSQADFVVLISGLSTAGAQVKKEPGKSASQALLEFRQETLGAGYSQVTTSPLDPIDVPASITSQSAERYNALRSGAEGTASVTGLTVVVARDDGWILFLQAESMGPTPEGATAEFKSANDAYNIVLGSLLGTFSPGVHP